VTEHITPEEHSDVVGGSTAARRMGCPASYRLEQLVPKDERGSDYAREGTALHELMAMTLRDGIEPTSILPYTFTAADGSWSFTVDRELWDEKGEPALAAFDRFCAKMEAEIGDDMHMLVERRVAVPGIEGAFGTSDIIARCGGELFVMDWKFGFKTVSAEANKQLMFYAAGALNTERAWISEQLAGDPTTPVTLAIIQPLNAQSGKEIVQHWETTCGDLATYMQELQAAVAEAKTPEARMAKGPWCDFARCKTVCPLHLNAVGVLGDKLAALKARQAASNGSPEDRIEWGQRYAELLEMAELAEPLVAEVFAQAHAYAEQGSQIPGWSLEAKKAGNRSWAVEERLLKLFFKRHRIKQDEWTERKVKSPAQIEKIVKARGIELPKHYVAAGVSSGTKLSRTEKVKKPVQSVPERLRALSDALLGRKA
jgi:Protein of unknown function (DUF2800)